jgi:hypothetical protein
MNLVRANGPLDIPARQREQQDTDDRRRHERDKSDHEQRLKQLLHRRSPPD